MTNQTCISIGSNFGNRLQNIHKAVDCLSKAQIKNIKTSSIYESEPVGFTSEDDFYNIVLIAQTTLSPMELLGVCQSIESEMGRVKTKTDEYKSRIIDLDIVYYNDLIMKSKDLTIPHPRAHLRSFVTTPLFEILEKHDRAVFNIFLKEIKKENMTYQKIAKILAYTPSNMKPARFVNTLKK